MNKGKYRVFVSLGHDGTYRRGRTTLFADGWSRFMRLCESLARDGMEYSVKLGQVMPGSYHEPSRMALEVRACGTIKPRKLAKRYTIKQTPMTNAQCTKRLTEAVAVREREIDRLRRKIRETVAPEKREGGRRCERTWGQYSLTPYQRRKMGQLLGRITRGDRSYAFTKHDYARLDKLAGTRVPRRSERPGYNGGNRWSIKGDAALTDFEFVVKRFCNGQTTKAEQHEAPTTYNGVAECMAALEDVEFWREMELLSGTRERFKPGKGPGVDVEDDEVAA